MVRLTLCDSITTKSLHFTCAGYCMVAIQKMKYVKRLEYVGEMRKYRTKYCIFVSECHTKINFLYKKYTQNRRIITKWSTSVVYDTSDLTVLC